MMRANEGGPLQVKKARKVQRFTVVLERDEDGLYVEPSDPWIWLVFNSLKPPHDCLKSMVGDFESDRYRTTSRD